MPNNKILERTQKFLANSNFSKALDTVSKYLDDGNHVNEAYILKAKALEGLGRIGEAHGFFGGRINWKNPSKNDLEMVKLTEKAAKANSWILAFHRLNYMYKIMSQSPKSDTNKEDESKISANLQMLEDPATVYEIFLTLAWSYFAQNDIVKSSFYVMAYRFFCPNPMKSEKLDIANSLSYFANTSDINRYLSKENKDTFAFVIERVDDAYEYDKMAQILSLMNKKVILISPPIAIDVGDNEYEIEYFLNLSYENMEIVGNIRYCTPF